MNYCHAPQDLFPRLRICDTGIWRVTNWFIIIIIIINNYYQPQISSPRVGPGAVSNWVSV